MIKQKALKIQQVFFFFILPHDSLQQSVVTPPSNFYLLKFLGILDLITNINIPVHLTVSLTRKTNKQKHHLLSYFSKTNGHVDLLVFTFNSYSKILAFN